MTHNAGIYLITSTKFPDRKYIGSSVDLHKRQRDHLRRFNKGDHANPIMQRHVNKHGIDDFIFKSVELVLDNHSLIKREQYYIDTIKPSFNICKIAGSTLGRPQSQETKNKRNAKLKGRKVKFSPKARANMAKAGQKRAMPIPKEHNGFKHIQQIGVDKNGYRMAMANCALCNAVQYTLWDNLRKRKKQHCGCWKKPKPVYTPKPRVYPKGYQSRQHGAMRKDNTSGWIGVTLCAASGDWRARVKHQGKLLDAGRYDNPLDAVKGRDQYIINNGLPHKTQTIR